ncbi:MAG: hypothetical protein ABSG03_24680 [Bryobacteraceae bacterium]
MATPFSPTRQDVERYRRLRALSTELNSRIVKTIPRHTYEEVGDAIGIRRNGVLVFENEDMTGVLMDCCLHDWFEDGKNLVQRYAETHSEAPETDESYLLSAYTQAKYRVILTLSSVLDAGVHCRDVLNNEDLFLMDLAMSRSLGSGEARRGTALATRTITLGEYWMTTGAFLPIPSKEVFQKAIIRADSAKHELLQGPGGVALSIVRACLASGAAEHVAYEPVKTQSRRPRIEPRFQFKRRRR